MSANTETTTTGEGTQPRTNSVRTFDARIDAPIPFPRNAAAQRINDVAALAAHIWAAADRNERTGIRFGLFPAYRMQQAKAEGIDMHALACALMDCARIDGGMRA